MKHGSETGPCFVVLKNKKDREINEEKTISGNTCFYHAAQYSRMRKKSRYSR